MVTRRQVLVAAATLPLAGRATAQLTCGTQTPRQTEGPFFSPNSPHRASLLERNSSGKPFVLSGVVLSPGCQPVANALVDLWHADEAGEYDNQGFRYRGHVFTDAEGRYRFETIVAGLYPGRTRHYHVKVQAPKRRILTTQLYFPGEPGNARDGIYRRELEMKVGNDTGHYDFFVDA